MRQEHEVLWLSAHPEPASLNGQLMRTGIDHLTQTGHAVTRSDLYRMGWDPVLRRDGLARDGERFRVSEHQRRAYVEQQLPDDVRAEQAKLSAADALVIQFPLWWYSVPAILKGWFDRVLTAGFAFGKDPQTGRRLRFEQGPFRGTRALVVVTLGDRPKSIGARGKSGELHEMLFGLLHGTLAYTGMSVLPPLAFPSADFTDDLAVEEHSARLRARLDGLFTDDPLPYRPQFTGEYTDEWELRADIEPEATGLSIHLSRPADGRRTD